MARTGAAAPASASCESKTQEAPLAPSTAGNIARLISSIRPARRNDPFVTPPPLSSRRLMPSSSFRMASARARDRVGARGEDVGDAVLAKTREVGIGDRLRQHHDDRIAADIGTTPCDLTLGVEHDAVGGSIAPDEPGLPRIDLFYMPGIRVELAVFLAGDAAHQPGIAAEPLMQALEQGSPAFVDGAPSAQRCAAVHARDHVADEIGLHERFAPA